MTWHEFKLEIDEWLKRNDKTDDVEISFINIIYPSTDYGCEIEIDTNGLVITD